MKILSIDTSTNNLSVAVSNDDKVLRYRNFTLNKVLASSILPSIEKVLQNTGMTIRQIDGYAVGLGPGSFTSLRVGLSTIKGLAFATQKPIVGVPSLDIIAQNVVEQKGDTVCVLCDAKRELVYSSLYERRNKYFKRVGDYALVSINDLLKQLQGDVLFIGDGLGIYRDAVKTQYQSNGKAAKPYFAPQKQWSPQAKVLAGIAYKKFCKKQYTDIDQLTPLYLYPEDCQVRSKSA